MAACGWLRAGAMGAYGSLGSRGLVLDLGVAAAMLVLHTAREGCRAVAVKLDQGDVRRRGVVYRGDVPECCCRGGCWTLAVDGAVVARRGRPRGPGADLCAGCRGELRQEGGVVHGDRQGQQGERRFGFVPTFAKKKKAGLGYVGYSHMEEAWLGFCNGGLPTNRGRRLCWERKEKI